MAGLVSGVGEGSEMIVLLCRSRCLVVSFAMRLGHPQVVPETRGLEDEGWRE